MNPNTGHLVELKPGDAMPADHELLPKRLQAFAMRELAGRAETVVNLSAPTPLADWAKKKRKAKIAAASRRRNRRNDRG